MSSGQAARLVAVAATGVLTASCASVTYVDASGAKHVMGFADVTVAPPKTTSAPLVLSVTTFGLAVRMASARQNGAVTLGYDKQTVLDLPANACVDLTTAGPCEALANSTAGSNRSSGATQ